MARADQGVYTLATGASATGAAVAIYGGEYIFMANGTPTGSTISLQVQMPDGTWCDVGALAGNAVVKSTTLPYTSSQIYLPPCNVRMAATGGTPTGLNAWLAGIG